MKVLVLGTGGREHALAWRISKDATVREVYLHPGNAGTQSTGIADLGDVSIENPQAIAMAARRLGIGLVVIGPEALLAKGYGDILRKEGFEVLGPGTAGAQLETSKAFAKRFLEAAGIPTAKSTPVDSKETLLQAVGSTFPIVLKLDGLAAGKGVVVAQSPKDVDGFIHRVWVQNEFGAGPHKVLVETFLPGRELSYIGLCDGEDFLALSSASDYKRLNDADQGPNTGGMGAISPSPLLTPALEARIRAEVVEPTLDQLRAEKINYRGALYFGLMISPDGTPYVLEFNARFGDPETQALMLRVQGDFTALLRATARGELGSARAPRWADNCAVYVVASAQGYPATPRGDDAIEGLNDLPENTTVFFSGVAKKQGGLATHGGRVLGVGSVAKTAEECRKNAYAALERIRWPGMHYRRDIGATFT